ncbi:MAG: TIM barrel protein [Gaiellales bacterium]
MTRISCSEYSFPAVSGQHDRIAIVRALGFELVDLALFLADDAELVADPGAVAGALRRSLVSHGLASEDVFLSVGSTIEEIAPNQRDPALRERGRRAFAAAARVAAELEVPGLTILPGVTWAEDPDGSWACCVEELGWRVAEAAALGVETRIEAHAGSVVAVPELVTRLCAELPALRLTLDLSHFELQSVTLDRALTLVPLAGHLHVRAAKPGAIQVRWRDNETDFAATLEALRAHGYTGAFCVEYVPMPKWRCDEMDVVTEALATRRALEELGVR